MRWGGGGRKDDVWYPVAVVVIAHGTIKKRALRHELGSSACHAKSRCNMRPHIIVIRLSENNPRAQTSKATSATATEKEHLLNKTTLQKSYHVYLHCIDMSRNKARVYARNEPNNWWEAANNIAILPQYSFLQISEETQTTSQTKNWKHLYTRERQWAKLKI